jgi:hypothetical protein
MNTHRLKYSLGALIACTVILVSGCTTTREADGVIIHERKSWTDFIPFVEHEPKQEPGDAPPSATDLTPPTNAAMVVQR